MKQLSVKVDSKTTLKFNATPLNHFTATLCDLSLKVKIPSEQETVNLKLWIKIEAGGGQGGTYTYFNLVAKLEENCEEVVTIIPYAYITGKLTQLKSVLILSNTTEEQVIRMVPNSNSDASGASYMPVCAEVYCGKNLIMTLGAKSTSATGLNNNEYFGNIVVSNGTTTTDTEPKKNISITYNSNSTYVIPLIEEKKTNKDKKLTTLKAVVDNKKYSYGFKLAQKSDLINSYKNAVPDIISNTISDNPSNDVVSKIPVVDSIYPIHGEYIDDKGNLIDFVSLNATDEDGNEYEAYVEWNASDNPEGMQDREDLVLRDKDNNIVGIGVVIKDENGNKIASDAVGIDENIQIIDLGNGYYGVKDSNGNTTINGNGIGGVQMQVVSNMGNGMILLIDNQGRNWVYDQNTGEYIPYF